MTTRTTLSIDEQLLAAEVAIDGSLIDPAIVTAVSPLGYTLIRLQSARALCDDIRTLISVQKHEYGEQYAATEATYAAWDAARSVYNITMQIARIAFKTDTQAQNSLMLTGRRKQSISGWVEQASVFYENLLGHANFMTAMAAFGYDQVRLEAEFALVTAVHTANTAQEHEKGDAQTATIARDVKLDELNEWLADYKVIATIALAATPQKLEGLQFGTV